MQIELNDFEVKTAIIQYLESKGWLGSNSICEDDVEVRAEAHGRGDEITLRYIITGLDEV